MYYSIKENILIKIHQLLSGYEISFDFYSISCNSINKNQFLTTIRFVILDLQNNKNLDYFTVSLLKIITCLKL